VKGKECFFSITRTDDLLTILFESDHSSLLQEEAIAHHQPVQIYASDWKAIRVGDEALGYGLFASLFLSLSVGVLFLSCALGSKPRD